MDSNINSRLAVYIDPPSHHFLDDKLFTYSGKLGDDLMAPHTALHKFFTERNITVHTADLIPDEDDDILKVYLSFGILDNYKHLANRNDILLSSFFAMECPIVDPRQYRRLPDAQKYFRHIFSWSDSESLVPFTGEPVNVETFCWPQSFNQVHEQYWSNRERGFLVMMNSNKLPALYRNELYTERMRAVEFFSRTGDIDLYGHEWDQPSIQLGGQHIPYTIRLARRTLKKWWQTVFHDPLLVAARKVYRGAAESKPEVFGNYTFTLCFENMVIRGWVTEKIFDCFYSGTIPVYLGSPDIADRIPEDCYIDMRKFRDYDELRTHLKTLTDEDIDKYRENARNFLASPAFQPYTKEKFVNTIVGAIEHDTGITLR